MPSPQSMTMLDVDQHPRQRQPVPTATTAPPASATTAASIWAPQPQPSETTWPRTLDSFSRVVADREPQHQQGQVAVRPELHHTTSMPSTMTTATAPLVTREDVFGPTPPQLNDARLLQQQQQHQQQPKEVGVIGDGRKTVTPEFDNSHVEQLLRTLDLNSPGPYHLKQKPSSLNLNFDHSSSRSPDFSPISISSALPTPTDLSPARSFVENGNYKEQNIGLNSPTDLLAAARANQPGASAYLAQQHGLIYDPPSPTRTATGNPAPYSPMHPMQSNAASYLQSTDLSSYTTLFKNLMEQQQSPTAVASNMSIPSYSPYVNHPALALATADANQRLFGIGGSPTSASPSQLLQASLRRSTGSADGSIGPYTDASSVQNSIARGLAGSSASEWAHIPPQVLQHQAMLAHQQQQAAATAAALQSYQLQQLQQRQMQADGTDGANSPLGEWQRMVEDGKLPPSLSHNGTSVATNTTSGPIGLGIVGYGAPAATSGTNAPGGGMSGVSGLEDSIHAVPQHMRSVSSYASPYPSTYPSGQQQQSQDSQTSSHTNAHQRHSTSGSPRDSHEPLQPINFLSLLHPSSSPPYHSFVARIIKSSDQQASIFLQQKLKVADAGERSKIVDAICARGFEMMAHRFGNWAVQRCLEAASSADERKKIVMCMRGRVVELATNCYGCHVLQKALDCEEDIRLLIVSELLLGDPAQTLVNKHASHVWSKIMELSWTPPAPPIFAYVNKSLRGKWAALACHETGSLVVQHAFENLEDNAKDGIVDELLNQGSAVFSEVAKNQWGSYCVQHILEHGSDKHRQLTLDHLINDLLDYATNEQGYKSITKALKEGGKDTLVRVIKRMCEPAKSGSRRAMVVDLALSVTGSQLIASVLPTADKDQRALLYECIRGHIVTLRGCKTGSKVIWLFDRMRAYYGY
ncbi:meiotic PUF protein 1 [Marasmius crinis-equi]|uniref:Meiotic PUF protein 1 n=1 Tax=Marasmius crinis-equi TaxID=585013 RepID=A0ABR3EX49_9AGAR